MNRKMNIAILFGGCSSEYSVSLESASSVIANLDPAKYSPVPVGITKSGAWFYFHGDPKCILEDTWHHAEHCTPAVLSPNRGEHALLVLTGGVQTIPLDAVFPVLHGRNGEDGTVQGLCELAGIPLVGCGTLASALCMDKERAHRLAQTVGVRVPRAFLLDTQDFSLPDIQQQAAEIGFPLFVKPVKAGSSYGVSKISSSDMLSAAIQEAFYYDNQVVLEEAIPGFEVGCAILGTQMLCTGEVDEIELQGGFFDFTEKYNLITSKIHVPARISAEKAAEIKACAKTIYRTLGCTGFARVDLFLTPDGNIVFNEVNTIPGFTAHSRFPSMMQAAGYSFPQILSMAIEEAVK